MPVRPIKYPIGVHPKENWILGPVGSCIDFLAIEIATAGVMVRGLELMPLLPKLAELASAEITRRSGPNAANFLEMLLPKEFGYEVMAEKLSRDDYAIPNAHTLVAVWSGLETCIEDTIVLALVNDPLSVQNISELGLLNKAAGSIDETAGRRIFRSLERRAREGRNVADAYDWLLKTIDVYRCPCTDVAETLSEANALRNAIMHNAGIVDSRALTSAPSLRMNIGEEIILSRARLLHYHKAVSDFVNEMLGGIVKSRHLKSKLELEQGRD